MENNPHVDKSNNGNRTDKNHGKSAELDLDGCREDVPNTKPGDSNFAEVTLSSINVDGIVSKVDHFISSFPDKKHEINPEWEVIETYAKLVQPEMESYVSGSTKIGQDSYKDGVLVETVSRIAKLTALLAHHEPTRSRELTQANLVFERTMTLMEDELRNILEEYTTATATDPTHEEDDFPGVSSEAVSRMSVIARVMISAGYETECCQVYTLLRRSAFKEAMKKSGFQKLSADQIQKMSWQQLESHIAKWTKAVKHSSDVLFPREQELCSCVFSDYPCVGQGLINNLARAILILFLNFVEEATTSIKLASETLFKVLEIYDALTLLRVAMPSANDTTNELKSEILAMQQRVGDAVMSIFDDLENSIVNDVAKNPVPNGAVHPLSRYTMNYLRYACDFKDTLEHVFKEHRRKEQVGDGRNGGEKSSKVSPLAAQLVRITELLDANLDAKSKLYKDPSLRYVFLMNNGRYMLRKIKESPEMRELVGGVSSRKRSTELRAYHKNYQRETWRKVLQCLTHEGLQVKGKVNKPLLKERLKNFNQLFEEILKTQGAWVVDDEQLRSELRVSISAVMIPAYRSFLASFGQYFSERREIEKYVKFQPEDIEATIEKLFDGNPNSVTRTRK